MCASPQIENGHTQIANEILEQLARIRLSPNQWQVILCIIRKTYGYHKKIDHISIGQYQKGTKLARRTVIDTCNRLVSYNALLRIKKDYITQYGIQKDYELWDLTPKEAMTFDTNLGNELTPKEAIPNTNNLTPIQGDLTPIQGDLSPKEVSKSLPKEAYTKDNKDTKQKTLTKDKSILPTWIKVETWNDFLEMRRKMKKDPTEKAKELVIKKLEKLKQSGNDPNEVLEQSIMSNYSGVFPLNKQSGGTNHGSNKALSSRELPTKYTTPEEWRRQQQQVGSPVPE